MYLSQAHSRKKLGEIARDFGVGHYAMVAVSIRRLRDSLEQDRVLTRRVAEIAAQLQ
ncbi:MAG: hypothetical protein KGJ56_06725 [Gammaproteobacteria bacterium]|nr:hypothetical protein [Gammaproteobacteria bacterium]